MATCPSHGLPVSAPAFARCRSRPEGPGQSAHLDGQKDPDMVVFCTLYLSLYGVGILQHLCLGQGNHFTSVYPGLI